MTVAFSVKCSSNCECDKFYYLKDPVKSDISSRKTRIVCENSFSNTPSNGDVSQEPISRKNIVNTCGNFCKCLPFHTVSKIVSLRLTGSRITCCANRLDFYLSALGDNGKKLNDIDPQNGSIMGCELH